MIQHISSDLLKISIKQTGMELCSIHHQKTGKEYMWQANPNIWAYHSPVLFPLIGLLKNAQTTILGNSYSIPKHGLLRDSQKPTLVSNSNHAVTFQLHWDEETLALYPFKFIFEVTFLVEGNQLTISHRIVNEDDKELLYNLGGHPAFNCPAVEGERYEDYFLEFEYPETFESGLLNNAGLLTNDIRMYGENTSILPLHSHLFDDDALIFRNLKSRKVSLVSQHSGPILSVQYNDFPYLGIWAKPQAPFVCIEPWHGLSDHEQTSGEFSEKELLRKLAPGEQEVLQYSITIH